MRKRSRAREFALKLLYQIDITKDQTPQDIEQYWSNYKNIEPQIKEFATSIVEGTLANSKKIDELISKYATNWQIDRMAVVDRNILRLGTYELLFKPDIPPKVVINEAVELAKRYGDLDSSAFVNGILDKINKSETR